MYRVTSVETDGLKLRTKYEWRAVKGEKEIEIRIHVRKLIDKDSNFLDFLMIHSVYYVYNLET